MRSTVVYRANGAGTLQPDHPIIAHQTLSILFSVGRNPAPPRIRVTTCCAASFDLFLLQGTNVLIGGRYSRPNRIPCVGLHNYLRLRRVGFIYRETTVHALILRENPKKKYFSSICYQIALLIMGRSSSGEFRQRNSSNYGRWTVDDAHSPLYCYHLCVQVCCCLSLLL